MNNCILIKINEIEKGKTLKQQVSASWKMKKRSVGNIDKVVATQRGTIVGIYDIIDILEVKDNRIEFVLEENNNMWSNFVGQIYKNNRSNPCTRIYFEF